MILHRSRKSLPKSPFLVCKENSFIRTKNEIETCWFTISRVKESHFRAFGNGSKRRPHGPVRGASLKGVKTHKRRNADTWPIRGYGSDGTIDFDWLIQGTHHRVIFHSLICGWSRLNLTCILHLLNFICSNWTKPYHAKWCSTVQSLPSIDRDRWNLTKL